MNQSEMNQREMNQSEMNQREMNQRIKSEYEPLHKTVIVSERLKPISIIVPAIVIALIIGIMCGYTYVQRKNIASDADQVTNQMAEYIAVNIANEIEYAKSSIRLSAQTISQTMTGATLDDPAAAIMPVLETTPFGGIEYIRPDGMNVMNIGEPFDASDRVYYKEGIKGNTGIWSNFHPKTSQETLLNFYTPLMYNDQIVGVITGYIAATSQIAPLYETKLYGQDIYGILVDENDMVICSTIESEYVKDQTFDMLLGNLGITAEKKQRLNDIIHGATETAVCYKNPRGQGRVCAAKVPGHDWKVVIIVPAASFNAIINENTRDSVAAVAVISLILVAYASYVLLSNIKRRKVIAIENEKLEEENRIFNEENVRVFGELSEIRDIIASAGMGTWRIELVDGALPRMFVDDTMKSLLGISGQERTPEKTYEDWYGNIVPDAVPSVLESVDRMKQGRFDENTYLWNHPTKGERYVRCGGTSQSIEGGYSLRGYHYDVDEVVREDQAKVDMLRKALNDKNEYYSTLETLGSVFNSMHVIDLAADTVIEFNANAEIRKYINHEKGIADMMKSVMKSLVLEEYLDAVLEYTDLNTIAERMTNKKALSQQFVGRTLGWFAASFVAMEVDGEGRPTKVIFVTHSIDEVKKKEESLIRKSQVDELTGLLNRRAYEEDIYEHNDVPDEEHFIYMSLDVNGLKVVNDNMGHAAGDELLIGASSCMRECLGPYGKVYRTGGDEFIAILFCDDSEMDRVIAGFDEKMANWSGSLVDSLSISYGWISKNERPELSVRQLGEIADQRMSEAKSNHYKKVGVDRRGQKDAHKALCALYTKILKINITDDSYQIVNMDESERSADMGFADKISEWLRQFGNTGQVHPDDLSEYMRCTDIQYMREYFSGDKTSLSIFYRRRYGDVFKQVMMEIIPANDYSDDNKSLFLYVKNIDK